MSQKIHPTSVRLRLQRTFDSSWYQDCNNYSKEFRKDQLIRQAIQSIFSSLSLNLTDLFLGRVFIQKNHKNSIITIIFYKKPSVFYSLSQTKNKKRKYFNFIFQKKSSSENKIKKIKNNSTPKSLMDIQNLPLFSKTENRRQLLKQVISQKKQETRFEFLQSVIFYKIRRRYKLDQSKIYPLNLKMIYFASLKNLVKDSLLSLQWKNYWNLKETFLNSDDVLANQRNHRYFLKNQRTHPFFLYIENALSSFLNQSVFVYPLVSRDMSRSAFFLAHKLVDLFEKNQKKKRMPYKIIKKLLANLSKKCLGIRILCSGRLGGVEMARKFSIKKGQTSLNVFSQRIDFAQHQALTRYGILGIKVWISY
jgi:ribosomal protein S3